MKLLKRCLIILPGMLSLSASAETATNPAPWVKEPLFGWGYEEWLMMALFLTVIIILQLIAEIMIRLKQFEKRKALAEGREYVRNVSWMDLFKRSRENRDKALEDHVVDGIQEFDNSPPAWFNWLFYGTIAWAACYMLYFHVFKIGDLQLAEYDKQMKAAEAVVAKAQEKAIELAEKPRYTDEAKLIKGKTVFLKNCVMCHGDKGQGLVGPNLTDEYWLHGGAYPNIFKTIFNGVLDKGMLSWKKTLKPDEIRAVASYVYTLRGTKPENPKEPQGEKFSEKEDASANAKTGRTAGQQ
jgi:mono/diheme cytochrome c family protein